MALLNFSLILSFVQFLVYIDPSESGVPMDMETDGPLLEDVNLLKKTVEEEALQVSVQSDSKDALML